MLLLDKWIVAHLLFDVAFDASERKENWLLNKHDKWRKCERIESMEGIQCSKQNEK